MTKRLLVTGGAGFIGSTVALAAAATGEWEVVVCDNLRRRGSELNLPRLRAAGVAFEHADVRHLDDLLALGAFDALVECSAEPSVMAAVDGSGQYVVDTNLVGAHHCLEAAARHGAHVVFLSTSRVYPLRHLNGLALDETATRMTMAQEQPVPGASEHGIGEAFPLDGARTLYGTTKLAGELLVAEYGESHGIATTINRCGVVAGPWQMGKVDQGVFTHWMKSIMAGQPLSYIGFGGTGKQVRDLLHVDDLTDLILRQLADPQRWDGTTFNVGGGVDCSLSLLETTALCAEIVGREVEVSGIPETRVGDVPIYVSDCRAIFAHDDWRPTRSARRVLEDIHAWLRDHGASVPG
ncbi:NAD-dependent epimerase/dehydratase family protein [Patulibacter minatonensis]|uniref:NAD-dependent epimerase/dehydratase family protein n=1 Tax=Patulibacter minatonensis TaxID=298163 RepID=UPI00047EED3C|nr:NAD-dependent epimerase/dehydratase family protein [Patulibacter minatonensis]